MPVVRALARAMIVVVLGVHLMRGCLTVAKEECQGIDGCLQWHHCKSQKQHDFPNPAGHECEVYRITS